MNYFSTEKNNDDTAYFPPKSGTWTDKGYNVNSDGNAENSIEELTPNVANNSAGIKKKDFLHRLRSTLNVYNREQVKVREEQLDKDILQLKNQLQNEKDHHTLPNHHFILAEIELKLANKKNKLQHLYDKYFEKGGSKTKKHRKIKKTDRKKSKISKKTVSKKKR